MKRPISAAAACCLTLASSALAVLTATPSSAAGSVVLTAVDAATTEDFDTLAATGTGHTTLPEGWWLAESGTNANGAYVAGTGSSTSGDTYSFGTGADRALGTLQSGSLVPTIGVSFTNGTDEVITSLDVTSPVTTGTVGALDGNAAASRTAVTGSVTGLAVEPGETVWLRWTDLNVSSSDDGLALDDVTVTPRAGEVEPPPPTPVCGDPATPLHEVQGPGDATPLAGEVQVEAVVVGDVQTGGLHAQPSLAGADLREGR